MSQVDDRTVKIGVLAAAGVVALLVGGLAVALLHGSGAPVAAVPAAPPATVPAPHPCDLTTLELPCWECLWAKNWPLRYRTDLDLLAPLGNGTANAATWFAEFAKPTGRRYAEAEAAMARRVEHGPVLPIAPKGFEVLPPGDPLLAEAAPWCDQASMRFYPDLFAVKGAETQLPNNLLILNLVRSWIARGHDAASFDDAMADFRRVIRLGRLLRQDDVVLIDDLLGGIYISWGAEAIYDRARKEGRTDLALLAAVIASEAAPQRYLTAARQTQIDIAPFARKMGDGSTSLELPPPAFAAIREMAMNSSERRFRNEAIESLWLVAGCGAPAMQTEARDLLERLAADVDPIVAANARWSLSNPVARQDAGKYLLWPRYQ